MVLQLNEALASVVGTPREWPIAQRTYESAIDYLAARELIDRTKVGIVGWSRTGTQVGYIH